MQEKTIVKRFFYPKMLCSAIFLWIILGCAFYLSITQDFADPETAIAIYCLLPFLFACIFSLFLFCIRKVTITDKRVKNTIEIILFSPAIYYNLKSLRYYASPLSGLF